METLVQPTKVYSCDKNRRIAESRKATKERRSSLQAKTIELGIDKTYAKPHLDKLGLLFIQAKWVVNDIVAHLEDGDLITWNDKIKQVDVRMGRNSDEYETRDLTVLSAKNKQGLLNRYKDNLSSLKASKDNGRKIGKLKYVKEVESIPYNQRGNDFDIDRERRMVKIQKIGWLRVHGLSQLPQDADIATGTLVKTARGFVFYLTFYVPKEDKTFVPGTIAGLDFGVKTFITTSDGQEITDTVVEPPRLGNLQRKLSKQTKGSNNYVKTCVDLRKCHLDMNHRKDDLANKIVNYLLSTYEVIVLQDENINAWKRLWGRKTHHSILGRVKEKMKDHPRVVMLDRFAPTTQYCPECEALNKYSLDKRVYSCPCGYTAPRDVHAARNMIILAALKPEMRKTNEDLDLSGFLETITTEYNTPSAERAGV